MKCGPSERTRRLLYMLLFLGPCVAYVVIWRVLPLLYTAYLSLTSWNLIHDPNPLFVGFANYQRFLRDHLAWRSLGITLVFTLASSLLELLLGAAVAILLDRKMRGQNLLRMAILTPMVLTPVVVGTIWYILFHNTLGPVSYLLRAVGLGGINWLGDPKTALSAIIISDVWQWTPFMFMLIYAGLQNVPDELYEAARVDGAAGFRILWHITLPSIKDTAIISLILRSMDAFREFDKVFIMTGGGPGSSTELVSILIYKSAFQYFDLGYSSTMVIVVLLLTSVLYSLYLRFTRFE